MCWCPLRRLWAAHYGLQLGSRQHELHLLSQHGGSRLLLDQIVPAVNLQLGLQVRRGVQVLAVVTCAAALREEGVGWGGDRDKEEEEEQGGEEEMNRGEGKGGTLQLSDTFHGLSVIRFQRVTAGKIRAPPPQLR